ncbi:MAG TPA: LysR substrate-binding domain-containing protein [Reyranella sp.]|nr:LysR substrate-binding domain-containing protein [Reyranella sp.]
MPPKRRQATAPSTVRRTRRRGAGKCRAGGAHGRATDRSAPGKDGAGAAVEDLNEFRNIPTGTLRLSIPTGAAHIVLAPIVKDFLAAHPAISLDITTDNRQSDIASGRFDAGIRAGRFVAKDMQIVRASVPPRLMAVASPD